MTELPATALGACVWVAGIILATRTMVPAYRYRARHAVTLWSRVRAFLAPRKG